MSYIRCGSAFMFVEGNSKDYIYPTEHEGKVYIEDYGGIKNDTLVELIATRLSEDKFGVGKYLIKCLAKKLKVKLREKPLTREQAFDLTLKEVEKFNEQNKNVSK